MAANLHDLAVRSLRAAAIAADSETCAKESSGPRHAAALRALWEELISGRAVVAENFCHLERCFLVTTGRRDPSARTGLTPRNIEILEHALLAPMQKTAAHDLGLSQSAVAFGAARCLRAMGLDCTASSAPTLVVAAAHAYHQVGSLAAGRTSRFAHDGSSYGTWSMPRPEPVDGELSDAERDIVRHIVERRSNREIAELRATSQRTVANQLARVLVKLGADGRLGVVQRLLRSRNLPGDDAQSELRKSLATG